ncbi:hypothetical protein KAH94_05815 [bacterium]|nr:hypothetical protein [bacterium]
MNIFKTLADYFLRYNSFLYWRDLIEITFFTALFYYTSLWLKKDKQKNLLPYFYGYCALSFGAHFIGLTTISYTLFLFAPITAMIFILIHQEFLQKNVVALKNITPAKHVTLNWLETLIKTSLLTIDSGKSITCIIEQQDSLQDLLTTPLFFNAQLKQELLTILLSSASFDQEKMVWVTTQGRFVGINAVWQKKITQHNLENNLHKMPKWKQQALFFTSKTDALVLHINPTSRTFDIVLNGMVIDRMHATKTLEFIKKYIISKKPSKMSGTNYEKLSKKSIFQQHSN